MNWSQLDAGAERERHPSDGRPAVTTGEGSRPRVLLRWDVALFLAVYQPELVRSLTLT